MIIIFKIIYYLNTACLKDTTPIYQKNYYNFIEYSTIKLIHDYKKQRNKI